MIFDRKRTDRECSRLTDLKITFSHVARCEGSEICVVVVLMFSAVSFRVHTNMTVKRLVQFLFIA